MLIKRQMFFELSMNPNPTSSVNLPVFRWLY